MRAVAVRLRAPTRPQHRPGAHGAIRAHDSLRQRSWALSASTLRVLHAQTSNGPLCSTSLQRPAAAAIEVSTAASRPVSELPGGARDRARPYSYDRAALLPCGGACRARHHSDAHGRLSPRKKPDGHLTGWARSSATFLFFQGTTSRSRVADPSVRSVVRLTSSRLRVPRYAWRREILWGS